MNRFSIAYIMLFACLSAFAQAAPDQSGAEASPQPSVSAAFLAGEALFMQNKPDDALGYLQAAVATSGAPIQAFLYLGIVYQQLGRIDEAIGVYRQVLPSAGENTALVASTLGNVYFGKGDFASAEQSYTQAIEADPASASAYLNRANARLQLGKAEDAADDYNQYLALDANSGKKAQIEQILALLKKEAEETSAAEAVAAQKKAEKEAAELARALAEAAAEQRKAEKQAAKLAKAAEAEQKAQEAIPAIESTIQAMDTLSSVLKTQAAQRATTPASPATDGDEKSASTMSAN